MINPGDALPAIKSTSCEKKIENTVFDFVRDN